MYGLDPYSVNSTGSASAPLTPIVPPPAGFMPGQNAPADLVSQLGELPAAINEPYDFARSQYLSEFNYPNLDEQLKNQFAASGSGIPAPDSVDPKPAMDTHTATHHGNTSSFSADYHGKVVTVTKTGELVTVNNGGHAHSYLATGQDKHKTAQEIGEQILYKDEHKNNPAPQSASQSANGSP